MAARYSAAYSSAMKCLTTDKGGLSAYLQFPAEHHHRVRHSTFIGRPPSAASCLTIGHA